MSEREREGAEGAEDAESAEAQPVAGEPAERPGVPATGGADLAEGAGEPSEPGGLGDDVDLGEGGLDDVDVRDLLRGALRPPPGSVAPELLGGVQQRLRVRSRGKFYGDGWSTAEAPRSTYLITSALMLVLILVALVLLIPWEAAGL